MYQNFSISLIFCAGGIGSRMGASTPKQYLTLEDKPIALYSFELFAASPEIDEIIVVCEPQYQSLFHCPHKPLSFALPGKERQLSVYSGLLKTSAQSDYVLTHDSARPFLERPYLLAVLEAVLRTGAAALAAPVVCTIKQCSSSRIVEKTLDRSRLWEMQTPQALSRSLFFDAFAHAFKNNINVTDDMALAESFGHTVEIVPSTSHNLKITTPFDLAVAKILLHSCATNSL